MVAQHGTFKNLRMHAVFDSLYVFVKPKTATIAYTAVALMMSGKDMQLHECLRSLKCGKAIATVLGAETNGDG